MGKSNFLGLLVLGGLAYALSGGEEPKAPTPTRSPSSTPAYRAAEPVWASLEPPAARPERVQPAPTPTPSVAVVYTKGQSVALRAEPRAEASIVERFPPN